MSSSVALWRKVVLLIADQEERSNPQPNVDVVVAAGLMGRAASASAGALEFLTKPGRQWLAQTVQQAEQLDVVVTVVLC